MTEHIVKSYDNELNTLKNYLVEMTSLTNEHLNKLYSIMCLDDANVALQQLEQLVNNDEKVDILDKNIVDLSLDILSLRNPVAHDLRFVFSASHISRNLERVGDNISKTAYCVKDIKNKHLLLQNKVLQMVYILMDMTNKTKESLQEENDDLALKIIEIDKKIDILFDEVSSLTLNEMKNLTNIITDLNGYSLIARSLERIGDHIVNSCRYIYFIKHNQLLYK
jgi:phosphate transport system protein